MKVQYSPPPNPKSRKNTISKKTLSSAQKEDSPKTDEALHRLAFAQTPRGAGHGRAASRRDYSASGPARPAPPLLSRPGRGPPPRPGLAWPCSGATSTPPRISPLTTPSFSSAILAPPTASRPGCRPFPGRPAEPEVVAREGRRNPSQ